MPSTNQSWSVKTDVLALWKRCSCQVCRLERSNYGWPR